jgi:hypothetical protein
MREKPVLDAATLLGSTEDSTYQGCNVSSLHRHQGHAHHFLRSESKITHKLMDTEAVIPGIGLAKLIDAWADGDKDLAKKWQLALADQAVDDDNAFHQVAGDKDAWEGLVGSVVPELAKKMNEWKANPEKKPAAPAVPAVPAVPVVPTAPAAGSTGAALAPLTPAPAVATNPSDIVFSSTTVVAVFSSAPLSDPGKSWQLRGTFQKEDESGPKVQVFAGPGNIVLLVASWSKKDEWLAEASEHAAAWRPDACLVLEVYTPGRLSSPKDGYVVSSDQKTIDRMVVLAKPANAFYKFVLPVNVKQTERLVAKLFHYASAATLKKLITSFSAQKSSVLALVKANAFENVLKGFALYALENAKAGRSVRIHVGDMTCPTCESEKHMVLLPPLPKK